jgi:membrane protein insertase Oxa1/YidC/SpoIIIJ
MHVRGPLSAWRFTHTLKRPARRGFASTPSIAMSAGGSIQLAVDIIRSIHDVSGLSYGVSIPLTAIALRTIITLPLAISSQRKLNRRIELRPLFYHWGEIIGSRTVARLKSQNVDLHKDKKAMAETMSRVQKIVKISNRNHANRSCQRE